MSAMIHVFSLMESNGIQIDVNYLRELCSGDSKINLLLKEIKEVLNPIASKIAEY